MIHYKLRVFGPIDKSLKLNLLYQTVVKLDPTKLDAIVTGGPGSKPDQNYVGEENMQNYV